jgi:dethiobiotin synthetase
MTGAGAALLGIVGTDTGVGKTAVTAALARALRARGRRVAAIKAVATGVPPGGVGEDAELLAAATGAEPADCLGLGLRLPRSPLAAARAEGARIDVDALLAVIRRAAAAPGRDLLLVEGTGGVLVPVTETVTVGGLLGRLAAPVVVVGRAGLGTVNHTALTVAACRDLGLDVLGVVLNDLDGVAAAVDPGFAAENASQIADQCAVAVLGILPRVERPDRLDVSALDLPALERSLRLSRP